MPERQLSSQTAVVIIDLDDFKSINDVLGHAFGDKALVGLSSILMETIKPPNIVGRLGGDEFVALAIETNEEDLKRLLAKLIEHIRAYKMDKNGTLFSFTVSIGAAFLEEQERTLDSALIRADDVLYDVKRKGKDGYAIYGEPI